MREKIAITGLSGVIGKKLREVLPKNIPIVDLYHTNASKGEAFENIEHRKVDLGKLDDIERVLGDINPTAIIHLAAITHIDRCEEDRKNGKNGAVWRINVDATEKVAKVAKELGSYLMFYSTECVFDGERASYKENAKTNPKNWYGVTKMEAERRVLRYCPDSSTVRSVITYYENDAGKTQFGFFLNKLRRGETVFAVTDQNATPTYTPDLVKASMIIIQRRLNGVFHIVPNKKITPFEFVNRLALKYGFDSKLIKEKTLGELFGKEKARLRLRNACLDGRRTEQILDFHPRTVDDVLENLIL